MAIESIGKSFYTSGDIMPAAGITASDDADLGIFASNDIKSGIKASDIQKVEYNIYEKKKIIFYKDGTVKTEDIKEDDLTGASKKDTAIRQPDAALKNSGTAASSMPADPVLNKEHAEQKPKIYKQEELPVYIEPEEQPVLKKKDRGVMFMPGVPVRVVHKSDK